MWEPVSKLEYVPLNAKGQVIVVADPLTRDDATLKDKWKTRGAALLGDSADYLCDVVRDLLANPHVRAIVFEGQASGRDAYASFWASSEIPDWKISSEHIALVRRYVDLYDDDFKRRIYFPPFWPTRIKYVEETK